MRPARACATLALLGLLAAGCQRPAPVATAVAASETDVLLSNQATMRDAGSAALLRGRVVLYHLWAEDAASSWTDADQADVRGRVRVALDFLGREARAHGIDVAFVEETAGRVRSASEIPTDTFADAIWTERLVQAAGAADANRLVADLVRRHGASAALIAIHVNKAAPSYHVTFRPDVYPLYAAERIVCFARYPDGSPTCAATYAHEILHNFGAGELYFPFDRTEDRLNRAGQLFPDDVMYRVDRNITKVHVGPFTAYRVGWTDRLDEGLRGFED